MKGILIAILIICIVFKLKAQTASSQEKLIKLILDRMIENQNLVLDQSDIELNLRECLSDPIILNKASREEFNRLVFLDPSQIEAILLHKKIYGQFLSKYELQSVKGLDLTTAELLGYFVNIEERKSSDFMPISKMIKKGKQEIILQDERLLEKTKGFSDPVSYAGSPDHLSIRYRFSFQNKLYFGFSLEKDAGEKWKQFGDFQSIHFLYKGKGLVQCIALGDFHANFGKGLNLGTSMFNGKSSLVFQSQYYGEGFKPYRSLNESGFLRGAGISLKKNKLGIDVWLSMIPISTSIQYDSLTKEDKLSSIALSGLHRTSTEISRRNSAWEQTGGINLKYQLKKLRIGMIMSKTERCSSSDLFTKNNLMRWTKPLLNTHSGFYTSYFLGNVTLSGEYSINSTGNQAYLVNGILPLHKMVDLTLTYRNYEQGFENSNSNAWSSLSSIGNEQGFYTAFAFKPKSNMQLNVFSDFYRSSGPKYLTNLPSKGSDYFVDYIYNYSKSFQIECRYRKQLVQKNIPSELTQVKVLAEELRAQYRLQINYQINSNWNYRFRAEKIIAKKTDGLLKNGNMIYHELTVHPKGKKWSVHGRICLFQIEDYIARIYVLENDVRYNYSQCQLNGNGTRFYLISSYKINKNLELNLRLAQSYLPEAETIGSSMDMIIGDKQTEIKFQLRWFTN